MGTMEVPADALYGATTQRAVLNFPVSGYRFGREFIRALGLIKKHAAATNAALDYLEKLYDMFGSWDLALAAYNWGEGAVSRAIAKNSARGLPTDYQSLNMPSETRYYVPRLQAVKSIIANPALYGLTLAEIPNRPYFTTVTTTRNMDIRLAAKLADTPVVIDVNGSVVPLKVVEVRSQISNLVREVLIKEGQTVQQGQPMFLLDDRNDRANVEKLRATLARDRAGKGHGPGGSNPLSR